MPPSAHDCGLVLQAELEARRGFPRGACPPDELALLPASDWWSTGMLLAFPMPMREDGVHAGKDIASVRKLEHYAFSSRDFLNK